MGRPLPPPPKRPKPKTQVKPAKKAVQDAPDTPKAKHSREELDKKKRLAYILYTENNMEGKMIAEITGISEKTISKWKISGDWETEREFAAIGPENISRRILRQFNGLLKIIEERDPPRNIADSKETDQLNKLADSVKKLQTEILKGHKTEVGKQFIAMVQQVHGQAKAIEILAYWHEFIMST